MACYHPMIRIEDLTVWNKAKDGHKYHPAKIIKQEDLNDIEKLKKYQGGMHYKTTIIPCNKCIGCRLDYSKEWANRAYLESLLYPNNSNWFVTLTYCDEALTINEEYKDKNGITWYIEDNERATLVPEDLHRFLNTLRKIMERDYGVTGIRYLACGEYGEENLRPHYHIILLNCPLPSETFYNAKLKRGYFYYQNKIIERAWNQEEKGISNISEASWNCISYTARYITKKVNGELATEVYDMNGIIKEFFRMSRDPGIGKPYYDIYKDKIYETDSILISNKSGIHREKPPQYFDSLLEKEKPEKWKEIKRKREAEGINSTRAKVEATSMFVRQQLEIEERSKEQQRKMLKREIEQNHAKRQS